MRLGIAAPLEIADKIIPIIKKDFLQIQPILYLYKSFLELPTILAKEQGQLDALLFTGKNVLTYAEKHITPTIPWESVPRSGSSLLQILLQITLSAQHNIFHISTDLYDQTQLQETYRELGLDYNNFEIYTIPDIPYDDTYSAYACAAHEQNYLYKKASCCITASYTVYQQLRAKEIPCYLYFPTASAIRQTLHKIQLNHLVQISQQSQIVALYLQIDTPSEYSVFNDDEYQYIIDRTNVTRQIYIFAQSIKAAVVEVGVREYLLFSTKYLLESVTNNFEKIDIMHTIKKHTASTLSVGVGYGATAQEAKSNANLGMQRSSTLGGDTAFIVYSKTKIIGPLHSQKKLSPEPKIDEKFLTISDKTEISINTIFHLHSIIKRQGKNQFTSSELAELLGVTLRTMNRIIVKLMKHEFCFEVGKRSLNKNGRPSRIVQINIL